MADGTSHARVERPLGSDWMNCSPWTGLDRAGTPVYSMLARHWSADPCSRQPGRPRATVEWTVGCVRRHCAADGDRRRASRAVNCADPLGCIRGEHVAVVRSVGADRRCVRQCEHHRLERSIACCKWNTDAGRHGRRPLRSHVEL